jgi:hypothetical protein
MTDYKSMYYHLSGRVAGAIESLEAVTASLKLAMLTTEEMFIAGDDDCDDPAEKNL